MEIKHFFTVFKKYFFEFYLFEGEKESLSVGEGQKQAAYWARSLMLCWIPGPWDHNLSWRQLLNLLSHPGAPTGFWCLYFPINVMYFFTLPLFFFFFFELAHTLFYLKKMKDKKEMEMRLEVVDSAWVRFFFKSFQF